jgi:hypothetical protein
LVLSEVTILALPLGTVSMVASQRLSKFFKRRNWS